MEDENRRREDEREEKGKRRRRPEDDGEDRERAAAPQPPADEEVEEFFAILKSTQAAVSYLRRRDGDLTAKPSWTPTFLPEDFDGVKTDPDAGPDLNPDPARDVSDSA